MDDLKAILAKHQIDVSTLQVMHEAGAETLFMLTCHGSEAIALWLRLRALVDLTGYWPVVMGEQHEMEEHRRFIRDESAYNRNLSSRELIARGLQLDPQAWFQHIRDEAEEDFEDEIVYARDDETEE